MTERVNRRGFLRRGAPGGRRGTGAAVLGNAIYVAGGGVTMGGGQPSAVNEAFQRLLINPRQARTR